MHSIVRNRRQLILISGLVIIVSLLLDNVIGISFLYSYKDRSSKFSYIYFTVVFAINFVAQLVLISCIVNVHVSGNVLKAKLLSSFKILMFISLTVLCIGVFILLYGMFSTNNYNPLIVLFMCIYQFATSMILISVLIFILSVWLKRKKNLTVFLYLMAFVFFSITTASASITLTQELEARTSFVSPEPNPWDISSVRKSVFYDIYRIGSLISFSLVWIATSLLLRNYITRHKSKIVQWKYWLLVSLPLIYYVLSIDLLINNLVTYIHEYPFLRNLIIYSFGATKQVGGVFFALSFLFMSRSVQNINLKNYLLFSAVGIMVLFSSLQITVLYIIPYPPFGLITLSAMAISYYLVLIGLYYSAKSLSFDKELLLTLKKRIRTEPESFLNGIGSAEWSENLETNVAQLMKHNMDVREAEDVASDLSTENVKRYVLEVLKEIKDKKAN